MRICHLPDVSAHDKYHVNCRGCELFKDDKCLKTCPFCGGKPHISMVGKFTEIYCPSCKTQIEFPDVKTALKTWNSRT